MLGQRVDLGHKTARGLQRRADRRAKVGQDITFNVLTLSDELHTVHVHGHR